jgi:hypothetical protein
MGRGGTRSGAGRKVGSKSHSGAEIKSRLAALNCDPIQGLVTIAQDAKASIDVRARVLIELAGYCHAKQRPVQPRRPIQLDADVTVERQGEQIMRALSVGELDAAEAGALLQGLGRLAEMQRLGALADLVSALASRAGIPLPPELRLRQGSALLPREAT